jgi:hypothetical protein
VGQRQSLRSSKPKFDSWRERHCFKRMQIQNGSVMTSVATIVGISLSVALFALEANAADYSALPGFYISQDAVPGSDSDHPVHRILFINSRPDVAPKDTFDVKEIAPNIGNRQNLLKKAHESRFIASLWEIGNGWIPRSDPQLSWVRTDDVNGILTHNEIQRYGHEPIRRVGFDVSNLPLLTLREYEEKTDEVPARLTPFKTVLHPERLFACSSTYMRTYRDGGLSYGTFDWIAVSTIDASGTSKATLFSGLAVPNVRYDISTRDGIEWHWIGTNVMKNEIVESGSGPLENFTRKYKVSESGWDDVRSSVTWECHSALRLAGK